MRTADLDYELPEAAIAVRPAEPRDAARLLVISRSDPARLEHRAVRDLPELLQPRDLLVFNTTRVLRARLQGHRADTGGRVEGLYLEDAPSNGPALRWLVLLRGRRMKPGVRVSLDLPQNAPSGRSLHLIAPGGDEPGSWIVEVEGGVPGQTSAAVLESIGATPLPPYILRARRHQGLEIADAQDRARYQTVYAAAEAPAGHGSVAAPTAGLHFTPELLDRLARRGVARADVELHVGTGTFRTVETEFVEDHPMHREWCSLGPAARAAIRRAKGRVIAIGTTSARTIESYAAVDTEDQDPPGAIPTRLLITPGYEWRWTDGLLTNFHLPRSTLLAMVAALLPGGAPHLLDLYRLALREGYRFFSYGDAMLVLP
ncbi:MAG: tRNA preQ1(34) S-adenosylmethionine ribosyltransferase-isomerase QueA [Phycisphaerales bacterium]|nr:tRNA preQ1(34) S-adenosylmethionine ribosyltransferase-isomerase QueA [Phycisphaerales bacterium]